MDVEDRRRIAQEEVYREGVRAEYRAARTREGLAVLVGGILGLANLGANVVLVGLWLVWSVLLFVVFVGSYASGNGGFGSVAGLLFFGLFFGPPLRTYLKHAGEERERKERAERLEKEREARERSEAGRREQDEANKEEGRRQKSARTGTYRTMAREWERRWSLLTKGLSEEETQRLHKEFLTDNPGRNDEERWRHIDRLFDAKGV